MNQLLRREDAALGVPTHPALLLRLRHVGEQLSEHRLKEVRGDRRRQPQV